MKDKKDIESFSESNRIPETFSFSESENQKSFLNEDFVFNFEENTKQTGIDSNSFDLGVEDNKVKPAQDDYSDEIKKAAEETAQGGSESSSASSSSSSTASSGGTSGASAASSSGAAAATGASSGIAAVAATATTAVVLVVGGGIAIYGQTVDKPSICKFETIEVVDNSLSYSFMVGNDLATIESGEDKTECNIYIEILLPGKNEPVFEQQIYTYGKAEGSFTELDYDTEYLLRVSQHIFTSDQQEIVDDYHQLIKDLFEREYLTFTFGDGTSEFYRFKTGPKNDTKTYTVTWKNYNGEVLEIDENVEEGTMPSYDGDAPTKAKDNSYIYSFNGWSPALSKVVADVTYTAQFKQESRYSFNVYKEVDPMGGESYSIRVTRSDKEPIPEYDEYFIGISPAVNSSYADNDKPYEPVEEWYYLANYDLLVDDKQSLRIGGNQLTDSSYLFGLIGRNMETEEDVTIYSTKIATSSFVSSSVTADGMYFKRVVNNNNGATSYYGKFVYSGSSSIENINGILTNPEDQTGSLACEFGLSLPNVDEELSYMFEQMNVDQYIPYIVRLEAMVDGRESQKVFEDTIDFGNIPTFYVDDPVVNSMGLGVVASMSGKYAAVTIDMDILDYSGLWDNSTYSVVLTEDTSENTPMVFNSDVNLMSFGIKDTLILSDLSTEDIQNYCSEIEFLFDVYHEGKHIYGPYSAGLLESDPVFLDGSFNLFYAQSSQTQQDTMPIAFEIYCNSYTDTSEFTRFELELMNTTTEDTTVINVNSLNKQQKTPLTSEDIDRLAPNYVVTTKGFRSDGTSKVIYQEEVDLSALDTQEWTEPEFYGATFNFEQSQSGLAEYMLVDLNYSDPLNSWNYIYNFTITITNDEDSTETYTSHVSTYHNREGLEQRYFLSQFNATIFRGYFSAPSASYSYSVAYDEELVLEPTTVSYTTSTADASIKAEWAQSMTNPNLYELRVSSDLDLNQDYYNYFYRIMLFVEDAETSDPDHYSNYFEMWMSGGSSTYQETISEITKDVYANAQFNFEVRAYNDQIWDDEFFNDPSNYTILYMETITFSDI